MLPIINQYYINWVSVVYFYKTMSNIDILKLESRYGENFPYYSNYFERPLRLNKYIYGITNYWKFFAGELTNWLIYEAGFNQSKFQMSVFYNYESDGSKLVVLSHVEDFVYCYTS